MKQAQRAAAALKELDTPALGFSFPELDGVEGFLSATSGAGEDFLSSLDGVAAVESDSGNELSA